jgi:hypothetical protein
VERSLRFQARREVLHQMAPKYRKASPSQKRTLLEAFVAATGYVRKYARWLLNHAEEVPQMDGRSHLRTYGPEVQHALFLIWHAANRICAKRLIPFLPTLVEALERQEHLHFSDECRSQLLSMSAAGWHGLSTTCAGTLLKQQIPIRMLKEWIETIARLDFQRNGRAYCDADREGGYPYTRTLNDIVFPAFHNDTFLSYLPPFLLLFNMLGRG